jgi:hypothetical protein
VNTDLIVLMIVIALTAAAVQWASRL